MLWLFVILGVAAFTAAAFGFLSTWRVGSIYSGIHFVALFLVAVAWILSHGAAAGWTALLIGILLELVGWGRVIVATGVRSEVPVHTAAESEIAPVPSPAPEPPQIPLSPEPTQIPPVLEVPKTVPPPAISFESICLLSSVWQASPEVFLASLRRGGARDSLLTSDSPTRYKVGKLELTLHHEPRPLSREVVDFSLIHTLDWPGAEESVKTHEAFIRFESHAPPQAPNNETIRLHVRAQQALLEFAPVIAVLWPSSGRLAPVALLRSWQLDEMDPSVCLSFRRFELEGKDLGKTLCDTLGLHALGLHDIEIVVDGEPDESVASMLYEEARGRLIQGRDLKQDEQLFLESNRYNVELTRSTFPPDRPVARMNFASTDQSSSNGESN